MSQGLQWKENLQIEEKKQNMGDFPNRPTSERLTGSRGEQNDGISTTKEKEVS